MKALSSICAVLLAFFSVSCETTKTSSAPTPPPMITKYQETGSVYHGKASWYSVKTNGGYATASGERFNEWADTAAHKTLPLGSRVKVTNLANGKHKVVRINDRGPYITGRIIDVSLGVAHDLEFVNRGVVPVTVEVVQKISVPAPVPEPEPRGLFAGAKKSAKPQSQQPKSPSRPATSRNQSGDPVAPQLARSLETLVGFVSEPFKGDNRVASTSIKRSETRLSARLGDVGQGLKTRLAAAQNQPSHRAQQKDREKRSLPGLRSLLRANRR